LGKRTLTEADNTLFTTLALRFTPLYFNAEYARAHGHPAVVIDPLFVVCTAVGLSVEDLSEAGGPFLGVEDVEFHCPRTRENIRTESSKASVTICLKNLRRPLPRLS
jgi:acyl dehydratase